MWKYNDKNKVVLDVLKMNDSQMHLMPSDEHAAETRVGEGPPPSPSLRGDVRELIFPQIKAHLQLVSSKRSTYRQLQASFFTVSIHTGCVISPTARRHIAPPPWNTFTQMLALVTCGPKASLCLSLNRNHSCVPFLSVIHPPYQT